MPDLPLLDCLTGSFLTTVDVSLVWTGTGPSSSSINNSLFRSGSETFHEHSRGISRDAIISGTLILDGTDLLAGLNIGDYSANLGVLSDVNLDVTR